MTGGGDEASIIVYIPGSDPLVAHSSHPSFRAICEAAIAGDENIADLFDVGVAITRAFERLSERVTTEDGKVYLDGDELHGSLVENILDSLNAGADDLSAQVNFLERMSTNPNPDSANQLYDWLTASEGFTLTPEGFIVGYKGVIPNGDGTFRSIHSGKARRNGVLVQGQVTNAIGDVIEMPRSEVTFDPQRGCSAGLHVGTYEYANGFAQGALLEVIVDPRDVVSVPTECSAQKMRVCRYTVVGTIEQKYESPVIGLSYGSVLDSSALWGDGEGDDDPEDFFSFWND